MTAWVLVAKRAAIRFLSPLEEHFLFLDEHDLLMACRMLAWIDRRQFDTSTVMEVEIDDAVMELAGDDQESLWRRWFDEPHGQAVSYTPKRFAKIGDVLGPMER